MNWHKWIGKKHVTGADPEYDEGCDCLLMVVRLREHLGLPVPDSMDVATMILLSQAEAHQDIYALITPHLVATESTCDGAFTIFDTPDQIGAAVMIDGGLLVVSHKRGVRWLPANMLRKFNWYHWK
jgi:hypothetical protein